MDRRSMILVALALGALGCQGGERSASCADAFDHMADLSVSRGGAALDADQRARHQEVLARAIGRELGSRCRDEQSDLIACVLDADAPSDAKSCWSKR